MFSKNKYVVSVVEAVICISSRVMRMAVTKWNLSFSTKRLMYAVHFLISF